MKTIATLALILISAVLPCVAQQAAPQQEKRRPGFLGLRGPVRSVREEQVGVTNENGEFIEGRRVLVITITYNEDGTKQEQTFYAPGGAIRNKMTRLYDLDGRPLEETNFTGRNHDLPFKTVYHLDSQKKVSEMIVYKPDGTILRQETIVRCENAQTTETMVYDQNGAVVSTNTAKNTPQSTTSEGYLFSSNGVIKEETSVTRTPKGGQVFERRENGNILYRQEVIPGEKGSVRTIFNTDGTIRRRERYTTEFDSHGNPIKMIKSVAEGDSTDFKLVEVTYRTIEYYE